MACLNGFRSSLRFILTRQPVKIDGSETTLKDPMTEDTAIQNKDVWNLSFLSIFDDASLHKVEFQNLISDRFDLHDYRIP